MDKKIKITLIVVISVILIALIGVLVYSLYFNDVPEDRQNIIVDDENKIDPVIPVSDIGDNEDNADSGGEEVENFPFLSVADGFFMTSTSIASDGSVVLLTAELDPFDATNSDIEWLTYWFNPISSWIIDKDVFDYISVDVAESGSNSAEVSFLQVFGEDIIIRASSVSNPEVYAECIVKYTSFLDNPSDYSLALSDSNSIRVPLVYGNGLYIVSAPSSPGSSASSYYFGSDLNDSTSFQEIDRYIYMDYLNDRFFFSYNNSLYYTFDCVNFYFAFSGDSNFSFNRFSFSYVNGVYFVYGSRHLRFSYRYSYDCENWISGSSSFDRYGNDKGLFYFNGYYYFCGIDSVYRSSDLTNWAEILDFSARTFYVYNDVFYIFGLGKDRFYVSFDGETFTSVSLSVGFSSTYFSYFFIDGKVVVLSASSNTAVFTSIYSSDGYNWINYFKEPFSKDSHFDFCGCEDYGFLFSYFNFTLAYSTDGFNWVYHTFENSIRDLSLVGDYLFVIFDDDSIVYYDISFLFGS
ncbi:MAG: hypothetical protein LBP62_02975 [Clostridiales bacterium]|jgi:hypothetical protein|nr:hypothetical protein [Clostridiales bacterium]